MVYAVDDDARVVTLVKVGHRRGLPLRISSDAPHTRAVKKNGAASVSGSAAS
jgi:hypothetical protein